MKLLVWGLNYKTVPIMIRESFSLSPELITKVLDSRLYEPYVPEVVILSTCNRTEIYAVGDDSITGKTIQSFVASLLPGAPIIDDSYVYTYTGNDCITHALRVAASLDSQILGEGQILNQVKEAYIRSHDSGATGTVLNLLFQQALTTGKRVRTETHIAYNAVSVSYAAVQLAEKILGSLEGHNLMVYGAGETATLTARNFCGKGTGSLYVVNRHIERAQELAQSLGGKAIHYKDVLSYGRHVDIIITSTGAPHYVLTEDKAMELSRDRNGKPLLLIDIAVPRDIDPKAGDIPGITLYNIDDLTTTVQRNEDAREREALLAETIVQDDAASLVERFRYLSVRPAMLRLWDKAETMRQREVRRACNKLPTLTEEQYRIIENMSHRIIRKVLRDPMMQIVDAAQTEKEEKIIHSISELFRL